MYRIVLDVMGGDFAPFSTLKGAELALQKFPELHLCLVGKETVLKSFKNEERVSLYYTEEVVGMDESPKDALKKKNASIFKGLELLKNREAQAFVSAGNSGAIVAGAIFILGRIEGVRRPAIATLIPSLKEPFVLIDSGANVDSKPFDLFQFGLMGSIFLEKVWKRKKPKIALLSIGEEMGKGNILVKKAHQLFISSNLNYVGNIESRDIFRGDVDVVVCDGFIGNICLKLSEGLAEVILEMLKSEVKNSFIYILGMKLAEGAIKNFKKKADWREHGGAPLLGVKGNVIIAHGRSDAIAIKNAIKVAIDFIKFNPIEHLEKAIIETLKIEEES
ncbi:Phosphate acyltransferase [Thermodesulfobacterium geofontis OPF15]|jgi:glycerol-3-phosphate acyltransferase PlsX|uniref:Phosphate acyltransferase n=1 Tax=Thermodesulfobacterium geofontis (strain OPF15) TaxID=795359 RepID=F8C247_THEGP|nr:phosphate acyltransferase PlsX [Thermodesulfobacterium geofontis]AEH22200.1 Phosphate acyltransferase [Thermodesulfobacterium geofontis OPF15]